MKLAVYRPNVSSFEGATPVTSDDCGGYLAFTPGIDGGGTYSIVVHADGAKPVTRVREPRRCRADRDRPSRPAARLAVLGRPEGQPRVERDVHAHLVAALGRPLAGGTPYSSFSSSGYVHVHVAEPLE